MIDFFNDFDKLNKTNKDKDNIENETNKDKDNIKNETNKDNIENETNKDNELQEIKDTISSLLDEIKALKSELVKEVSENED